MADSQKSRGMKFAEQQLLRHGWTEGKGLGREENGISEAIKVKVKCNKEGIGHNKAEEFTFHWWDHVFNKASSSLQVESDQNGVEVKTSSDVEGNVSNKKPRRAALAKDKMYGCFVKAGTLLSGEEQPEPLNRDPSSSSEDDDSMDLSSTTRLSDADLMKACGGRTAHKGARHGFNMSAKLARLEQQEAEFMAKYGKKNHLSNNQPEKSIPFDQSAARSQEETSEVPQKKKKKKKKSAIVEEEDSTPQEERRRRKRGEEHEEEGVMEVAMVTAEGSLEKQPSKKKKSKSCREERKTEEECPPKPKKKKKKRRKEKEDETNMEERIEEDQTRKEAQATAAPKRKEKEETKMEEDQTQEEAQATAPPKRKRKKEFKE
ncbi:G patch domain-containing protein 4 [Merluccius polli]|uniref:G patch domain-containing protein 4 n=1 Tax=Merluccius polli TaxID=89951 RepID=A0AA47NAN9_MERPO|nr:G patch domain-containing protein 4 [Merluccius polli]